MSSISKLVSTALATFRSLEHLAQTHVPARATTIRSDLTRFKLWAGSIGAHRRYGHRSLEYRLSGASMIRGHVLTLLEDMCKHLEEAEIVLRRDSQGPEDGPQQDDGLLRDYFTDDEPDVDDFQQILQQVKNDVNCLMRLAVTIRNPAPHEQFKLRMPALVSSFDASHTEHVLHKFPRLQPEIAERLGKALTYRRLFLRYREEHHERLNEGIDFRREGDKHDEKEESRGAVTTEASWLPKDNPQDDEHRPHVWRDDISEQTGTSYAPSCVDDSELRVPHIPPEYIDGPFICPYCFLPISIENRYQWKQHVFSDLRPYSCLEPGCAYGETGFSRRKYWFSHIVREHWRTWTCPFGCAERLTTSKLLSEHMRQMHGSATTIPEVDLGSRDDLTLANGNCPLCWEYEIVSSRQYQSHVGRHLEQLALFALPGTKATEEQIEEEADEISHSESDGTEDKNQPTDDYEQEQNIPLNGSPKTNAINEEINVLDMQQSDNSTDELGLSEALGIKAANKEVTPRIVWVVPSRVTKRITYESWNYEEAFQEGKKAKEGLLKEIEDYKARRAKQFTNATGDDKAPLTLIAAGVEFIFSWHLCSTWSKMERLMNAVFKKLELVDPHVQEGHYDLLSPGGEIILPAVWEKVVQPGWQITMRMWPVKDQQPPDQPPPPAGLTHDQAIRWQDWPRLSVEAQQQQQQHQPTEQERPSPEQTAESSYAMLERWRTEQQRQEATERAMDLVQARAQAPGSLASPLPGGEDGRPVEDLTVDTRKGKAADRKITY